LVVWCIAQRHLARPVDRHPIFRVWQVLGCQPEINGVIGQVVEQAGREEGGFERLLSAVHRAQRLAEHLDVAHGVLEPFHSEIKVIERERFLKNGRVGFE
jgi:hypothetical protein